MDTILAGDIGGTNFRLALFEATEDALTIRAENTFPSRDRERAESVVSELLSHSKQKLTSACFGIAGPVLDGRCKTTNLPWIVDQKHVRKRLNLSSVALINDLLANAYGVFVLKAKDFVVLNKGKQNAKGNMAVISAGTGLGEAGLFWDGRTHHPFASEGGHADFAPRNKLEIELLEHFLHRHPQVGVERIVSGPGLTAVYHFLRDAGKGEEPAWLAELLLQGDQSAVISACAMEGRSSLCAQALELFISLYGAEAGNAALKFMAVGGVYLGGGIAPKIASKLNDSEFMTSFTAKGRMQALLQSIPVRVIINQNTALYGAARYAALHFGSCRDYRKIG